MNNTLHTLILSATVILLGIIVAVVGSHADGEQGNGAKTEEPAKKAVLVQKVEENLQNAEEGFSGEGEEAQAEAAPVTVKKGQSAAPAKTDDSELSIEDMVDENGEMTEYVQVETPSYDSFTMDFDASLSGDDDTM